MRQTLHETVPFRVPAGFKAAVAEIAARKHLTPCIEVGVAFESKRA